MYRKLLIPMLLAAAILCTACSAAPGSSLEDTEVLGGPTLTLFDDPPAGMSPEETQAYVLENTGIQLERYDREHDYYLAPAYGTGETALFGETWTFSSVSFNGQDELYGIDFRFSENIEGDVQTSDSQKEILSRYSDLYAQLYAHFGKPTSGCVLVGDPLSPDRRQEPFPFLKNGLPDVDALAETCKSTAYVKICLGFDDVLLYAWSRNFTYMNTPHIMIGLDYNSLEYLPENLRDIVLEDRALAL